MENLLGVVMCGGESKRMGRDKGLLETKNTPWAKVIANIFVDLGLEYILSINANQKASYARIFDDKQLVVDDGLPVKGPLKGLLSVHEKYPATDLLLIACDLQDMDSTTVHRLIQSYRSNESYQFYAYAVQGLTEPLCGIYTAEALKDLYTIAVQESLKSFSLQKVINSGTSKFISLDTSTRFKNYNFLD